MQPDRGQRELEGQHRQAEQAEADRSEPGTVIPGDAPRDQARHRAGEHQVGADGQPQHRSPGGWPAGGHDRGCRRKVVDPGGEAARQPQLAQPTAGQGEAAVEQSPDRRRGHEHRQQVEQGEGRPTDAGSRGGAARRRQASSRCGRARAPARVRQRGEHPDGQCGDQQPGQPAVAEVRPGRERRMIQDQQGGEVRRGQQERGGVGGEGGGHRETAGGQPPLPGDRQGHRHGDDHGDVEVHQAAEQRRETERARDRQPVGRGRRDDQAGEHPEEPHAIQRQPAGDHRRQGQERRPGGAGGVEKGAVAHQGGDHRKAQRRPPDPGADRIAMCRYPGASDDAKRARDDGLDLHAVLPAAANLVGLRRPQTR